ncbi:MAG: hypothetical protein J6M62_11760 [Selenomonadaceae bacterium]|nr:hypothetical protein [Selenomonadaceae bacterium]
MATAVETMTKFMNALTKYSNDTTTSGVAILDEAVKETTRFNGLQDAINSFVNDVSDTEAIPDLNQRLWETCGIVLGKKDDFTTDTGAVSGYNAGGLTVKDAAGIVPETGTLSELAMPKAGSTTTHKYINADGKECTFYIEWPASFTQAIDRKWQTYSTYNPDLWTTVELTDQVFSETKDGEKIYTAEQLKKSIETITKGMEYWWADESAKLISDSYGIDFDGKTLRVRFLVNQENVQADTGATDKKENDTTPSNVIEMTFALPLYAKIDPDDPNGNTRVDGGTYMNYLDRTVAHEMVHAVMYSNGTAKIYENNGVVTMPEFFTEGIAELVMGLDDYDGGNMERIEKLAADKSALADAMTLSGGTGTSIRYTSGYMFLRYLCQQSMEANDILSLIDAKGEAYSPIDTALLKAGDYMSPSASVNTDTAAINTQDVNSLLTNTESINPMLFYASNI